MHTDKQKEERNQAMLWWNKLETSRKVIFTDTYFSGRNYDSLTGREIQIIYSKNFNFPNPHPLQVEVEKIWNENSFSLDAGTTLRRHIDYMTKETFIKLYSAKVQVEEREPYGYIFERMFYKDINELEGFTFWDAHKPIPVWLSMPSKR